MSKFKFDADICIHNESFDIHFHLSGEIDVDFEPGDAPGEPDDPYDKPGEDDDTDWLDCDPDEPCGPPLNYN